MRTRAHTVATVCVCVRARLGGRDAIALLAWCHQRTYCSQYCISTIRDVSLQAIVVNARQHARSIRYSLRSHHTA